jgi:hypothetical protein
VEALETEKQNLEKERALMMAEQNKESEQWKMRYREMTSKNDEIMANLAEANKCYFAQVTENEKLTKQISDLQSDHRDLIKKFEKIQTELNNK